MPDPTPTIPETNADEVRVGVSACLLGQEVRMNGGHCRKPWITDVLGAHVTWVSVCPEVEMGLPVPRPTMRLVRSPAADESDDLRLVVTDTGEDLTERIDAWAHARLDALDAERLHGYILKKDSPSCGAFRVKVYDRNGSPSERGTGRFAAALRARFPNLPVEEEGRLNDRALRESFLVRVFAYARWRRYLREDGSMAGLMRFHATHKYALLAADPKRHRELGRMIGNAAPADLEALQRDYEAGLLEALTRTTTRGRHVNVMQHLLGFVKEHLTAEDKRELERQMELYRGGAVPRSAPLALVAHLLRRHEAPAWAREQVYLQPFPPELHTNEAV